MTGGESSTVQELTQLMNVHQTASDDSGLEPSDAHPVSAKYVEVGRAAQYW